ncbi:hypothetical protein SIO70_02050 [Chitinophaga sancti]|uniref:hypothetical protein n=1 Tax=Chitinophaga sancti TaxID=1004 RepID=UPI002A755917|nr:hypothetical protein [Chitinophaga sancti]WPQ63644.1 hypothetical protein SIO70_02050 [Chitinophaga sancti]
MSRTSIWSILLPLFTGIICLRRLGKDSQIILGIVALATIPQILRAFISSGPVLNMVYNAYTICEVILYCLLFSDKINHYNRNRIFIITAMVILFCNVVLTICNGLQERFISELVCLDNIAYTVWLLLIILDQYDAEDKGIDPNMPFFWYLLGLLLYAPCTMLIYSLWSYIKNHPDSALNQLWVIQYIFNITMYVLFSVGFLHECKRHADR